MSKDCRNSFKGGLVPDSIRQIQIVPLIFL